MTDLVNKDTYRHKDTEVWTFFRGGGWGKEMLLGASNASMISHIVHTHEVHEITKSDKR